MAKIAGSNHMIRIVVVAALLAGVAAAHVVLVSRHPVFPAASFKNPGLASHFAMKPDFAPSAIPIDESSKLAGDLFQEDLPMRQILLKYRELDHENGRESLKTDFGAWAAKIALVNLALVLVSIAAAMLFRMGGAAAAGAAAAGAVWATWNYVHLPTLAEQVKLWILLAVTNGRFEEAVLAAQDAVTWHGGLTSMMKTLVTAQAAFCLFGGLAFAFLYERLTNNLVVDLEAKNSEMMTLQASMFKYQNADVELKKLSNKFQSLSNRLTVLQTFTQEVGKTLNVGEVCKKAIAVTVKSLSAEKCALYLYNDETNELEAVDAWGWNDEEKKEKAKVDKEDGGLVMRAISSERIQSVSADEEQSGVRAAYAMSAKKSIPSVMCAPLIVGEKKIGALNIEKMENAPEQDEIRLFYYIATLTGMAVQNSKLFQKTENLANFDGLTQLYTRRFMLDFLERKLDESKRYKHPVSIILSDIDHFKRFNDDHGHQVGDYVLKETAKVFKSAVRNVDLAARYGGEEFIAILPETDYKGAYAFAERLRRLVEARSYTKDDGTLLKVTISLGISQFPLHHTDSKNLIEKADNALYMAKEGGRNQVKVAPISKEALKKYQETQQKE